MDEHSSLLTPVAHSIQLPPVAHGSVETLDAPASVSSPLSVSVDGEPRLPEDKGRFGRPYLRFTILFAALIVVIATMPLWLSVATPQYSVAICGGITLLIGIEWLVIASNAVLNYRRLGRVRIPDWPSVVALRNRRFKHIVIVPCYLDPLDVLEKCIASLAVSARAADLVTVVTFERKTPELERKMEAVQAAFGRDCFGDFLAVVHDLAPATEIPGGCSNKNFAIRTAFAYCSQKYGKIIDDSTTRVTLTTCDTDSLFHPLYFETLEAEYNAENPASDRPPRNCVWQPPLFYNWGLDSRPFFNRVTCLMRTTMMLGGLISFNLNPMSIFSYPLEMAYTAGFINPRYGVDDIIAKVRWMCDTNSAVPVKLLPVPVISGPTIGQSFAEEATEWGRQIRRWIVGSSESFHYFLIHFGGRPFFPGLLWFGTFFSYYGVLLCCAGLFSVFAAIPFPWQEESFIELPGFRFNLRYCGAVSFAFQMIAFAIAFFIDAAGAPRLGVKENINPLRNVLHWASSPFVLLVYSAIAFISIVRFVFQGKKMAGHDMAAKEGFSTVAPSHPVSTPSHSPVAPRWQAV